MRKINQIIKKHIYIILPSVAFLIIAIVYANIKIGFLSDFERNFYIALTGDSIWHGEYEIQHYPLFSRYFPLALSHLSVTISMLFGIVNIQYLLTIFTFVVFSSHVIFLIVIYLNLPRNKKNIFDIILFSFMGYIFYLQHFILSESFLTGLFIWIIFVIYFYVDFSKLSVLNSLSLSVFSIFLISSYPSVTFFIPIMLFFAITKYLKTKNITKINHIILIMSFVILIVAFIFNFYEILYPEMPLKNSNLGFYMFQDWDFILFYIFLIIILIFSLLKNKYEKIILPIIILLSVAIEYVLFQIPPIFGHLYRILSFVTPFLFMIFLICLSKFKLNLNFIYIKIVNAILIFWFLINSIIYAENIKNYNIQIIKYMSNNKEISIKKFQKQNSRYKYALFYAIFIKSAFLGKDNVCKLVILPEDKDINGTSLINYVISRNEKLKKIKINLDDFIKVVLE